MQKKTTLCFLQIRHEKRIPLIVYVVDIVIIGDDTKGIDSLNKYLQKHFQNKNLGSLKYFLGTEVAKSQKGFFRHGESIYSTCFQRLECYDAGVLIF